MRRTRAFVARTVGASRLLARDARIPRPLRWLAALALLPIPGPVDEAVLLLVAVPLFVFYRGPMQEAWHAAGGLPSTPDANMCSCPTSSSTRTRPTPSSTAPPSPRSSRSPR